MRVRRFVIVAVALIVLTATGAAAATALNNRGDAGGAASQFQSPPAEMTPAQSDAIPSRTGTYP